MHVRSPMRSVAALVVALLLAGCTDVRSDAPGTQRSQQHASSGELSVAEGIHEIAGPHVVGEKLYGPRTSGGPAALGGVVNAPFFATLAPPVVPDASGRFLAYHSVKDERPILVVRDLTTHGESRLAEGAYSLAWASNGTLAYFQGTEPRIRDPQRYVGHVVVRRALGAPATRWTTRADRYVVAAWADGRLLVHRMRAGWTDILVLDGPGRERVLAQRAALVAVSPDGSRAFITRQPAPSPVVGVVDIADGKSRATLDLATVPDQVASEAISYVADSGSWVGEEIVAAVNAGLVVFRLDSRGILLHQRLRIDPEMFPTGLSMPRADDSGRRILAWGELKEKPAAVPVNVILQCDRMTRQCLRGHFVAAPLAPAVVYNPSRP